MKARNREINIFSLSLMDVISGAMGSFLIVMVILAQYYVLDPETTEDVDGMREKLDAAIAGLAKIRDGTEGIFSDLIDSPDGARTSAMDGTDSAGAIEELGRAISADIERVENQLAAVHAEANRLESELQQSAAQLTRAQGLIDRLEMRRPLVVAAQWDCDANIDLFLESDRVSVQTNEPGAKFDPRARGQQRFTGDVTSDTSRGPGAEMSLVSETPGGSRYKLYVNIMAGPPDVVCAVVTHAISYDGFFVAPPSTVLTFEKPFDYLGVISVDEAFKIEFREPTPKEREVDIAAVRKRILGTPAPK